MNTQLQYNVLNNSVLSTCHTLLFVYPSADLSGLSVDLSQGGMVQIILGHHSNGIEQIAAVLAQCPHVRSVYIHTTGGPGKLQLGQLTLTAHNIERYSWELQSWFAHLPSFFQPSLILGGCNVGDGAKGIMLIDKLRHLTRSHIRCTHSSSRCHLQLV
ncbi:MAG: DUF4347 domain-containing protein [Symploca sp. SIO3C6]|nr:DUF4347 domain-containing protein [Symploca sp. SIO3C6]